MSEDGSHNNYAVNDDPRNDKAGGYTSDRDHNEGFHVNMDYAPSIELCERCHGNQFGQRDGIAFCNNCGLESQRHAMNATLEYEPLLKATKAKK